MDQAHSAKKYSVYDCIHISFETLQPMNESMPFLIEREV
jgi:hypothetical protein